MSQRSGGAVSTGGAGGGGGAIVWVTFDADTLTNSSYSVVVGAGGAGGVGSTTGTGNVGITGFARVDGDLYVKGNTVNFTGKGGQTFSADFNVIHIGGLTGDKLLAGSNWRTSDKGLVIQNRAGAIATPLASAQGADSLSKSSFVGVIHNTGTLS